MSVQKGVDLLGIDFEASGTLDVPVRNSCSNLSSVASGETNNQSLSLLGSEPLSGSPFVFSAPSSFSSGSSLEVQSTIDRSLMLEYILSGESLLECDSRSAGGSSLSSGSSPSAQSSPYGFIPFSQRLCDLWSSLEASGTLDASVVRGFECFNEGNVLGVDLTAANSLFIVRFNVFPFFPFF